MDEELAGAGEGLGVRDLAVVALWALGGRAAERGYVHSLLYILCKVSVEPALCPGFEERRGVPWSQAVAHAMDILVDEDVLGYEDGRVVLKDEHTAVSVVERADRGLLETARVCGGLLSSMSYGEMLLYTCVVYGGCPASEARDETFAERRRRAVSMLQKGLVSVGLAARLAGLGYREFIQYLKGRGIKPFVAVEEDIGEARRTTSRIRF